MSSRLVSGSNPDRAAGQVRSVIKKFGGSVAAPRTTNVELPLKAVALSEFKFIYCSNSNFEIIGPLGEFGFR